MSRRIVVVVLVFVLALLALTFATLAAGNEGSATRTPRPSMSGEFAHTHFA
jgi:hypothetical protein